MCELFALSASAPVRIRFDLDRFAAEGGERHQNRDGWGLVIAEGRDARYYREADAASNSPLDRFVREHVSPHSAVMAHVRRASAGRRALANTHPFRRVRGGRVHHFAHNGTLHGLERMAGAGRLRCDCIGETDSELAFLLLLERALQAAPGEAARNDTSREDTAPEDTGLEGASLDRRFAAFHAFCTDMAALGSANFIWFDGDTFFIHADRRVHETPEGPTPPRPPGLHILRPAPGDLGQAHECAGASLDALPQRIVLFASVPLSDAAWEPLPRGSVLAVSAGQVVRSVGIA